MRLLAAWARTLPTRASTNHVQLKPLSPTARRPATSPAVSVIGSTDARVSTSHRDPGSRRPDGGLVVRSTSRQFASRPWVETSRAPVFIVEGSAIVWDATWHARDMVSRTARRRRRRHVHPPTAQLHVV